MTQECVEMLIRKDMLDPVTGDKLAERDIIRLQRVSSSVLTSSKSQFAACDTFITTNLYVTDYLVRKTYFIECKYDKKMLPCV